MTRNFLYEEFTEACGELISYDSFAQTLREDFPDLKFPKVSDFSKCDECTNLRTALSNTRNPQEKAEARRAFQDHVNFQMYPSSTTLER